MPSLQSLRAPSLVRLLVLAPLLGACGGSGSSSAIPPGDVGELQEDPQGALFFVDLHHNGVGRAPALVETAWARLVDLYAVDGSGAREPEPLLRDLPVRPDLQGDGVDFELESDATGRGLLVILHERGTAEFEAALRDAAQSLPEIEPRDDDGTTPGPFSFVARNAAIVLRFDDLLDDRAAIANGLSSSVRLRVGYPPSTPYVSRVFFDTSHGGLLEGRRRPTRVVIDVTPSALEPGAPPLVVNPVGLPPSRSGLDLPNVSVRVATREDFGSGVFSVLLNLAGRAVDPLRNGPNDLGSLTDDVVRALRSGNPSDPSNGFLLDLDPPSLLGRWVARVDGAAAVPGELGTYQLDLTFETTCAKALLAGELLEAGIGFLQVTEASAPPDGNGAITGVRALWREEGTPPAGQLLGRAHVWTRLSDNPGVEPECFVEAVGAVAADPGAAILPDARFRLRFDEPMAPESFDALEGLRLYTGAQPSSTASVVGQVIASPEAVQFDFLPRLPLAHTLGNGEIYRLELVAGAGGVTDLAGNALDQALPPIAFQVDSIAPSVGSGGLSLRFAALDEYGPGGVPDGLPDLRGLFEHDTERGALRGRPVVRRSSPIDGTSGLTSFMLRLPVGVREPLGRMGSRLQTLWRYADAGMRVEDETLYDLDVEGVAWAPFGGGVVSDFYEAFELRLAHAVQLPDEVVNGGALTFPGSGLLDAPAEFDDNVLEPGGPRAVNFRSLGYRIDPTERFQSTTGTILMPFPVQVGGALPPFTWRDTALQGRAGFGGAGVPLTIERLLDPSIVAGSFAPAGDVPSVGLALLLDIAAFPSDTLLGLNDFQVAIAASGQLFPTFRVHSTGGRNTAGADVRIDPDEAVVPSGGFDATTSPPGQPTRSADPALYFGQLDTVTRLTRVHSIWFDTGSADPDYEEPLITPAPALQPAGSELVLEFRGANGFLGTSGSERDASTFDVYGELTTGTVQFPGSNAWTRDIDDIDGLRYVQVRITLSSDVESGLPPTIESLAIAYRRP